MGTSSQFAALELELPETALVAHSGMPEVDTPPVGHSSMPEVEIPPVGHSSMPGMEILPAGQPDELGASSTGGLGVPKATLIGESNGPVAFPSNSSMLPSVPFAKGKEILVLHIDDSESFEDLDPPTLVASAWCSRPYT